MTLIVLGIFVKKDIALIWDQNELSSLKGIMEIEKNMCCAASWKGVAAGAASRKIEFSTDFRLI